MQHRPLLAVPQPLATLFSYFPFKAYPPLRPPKIPIVEPSLWVHPPSPRLPGQQCVLSADIECLKWQAHIALRGARNVSVRWDVSQDGALEGRLPNLQIPSQKGLDGDLLLAAQDIPTWIDEKFGALDDLEGYKDVESRDEGHAWIALLEGDVHAAFALAQPPPSFFCHTVLQLPPSTAQRPIETILTTPPAPLSGFSSFLPPYGARLSPNAIASRYRDAVSALSECLGKHEWFLGSPGPTALDAAAFAYLHVLLHAEDDLRIEIARRANLVYWERRVHERVSAAFVPYTVSK
ncbi:hypothetical protein F5148DRAFT_978115 [Russula earlei]|uniref:Uncharacterized protein n=1 Tax=Russula earlei TaxID=71964 RepID=A0ACC0UDE6_9AGAM|nr:hypothetical protein F5148DRAFT_978115 [Russula earlei]